MYKSVSLFPPNYLCARVFRKLSRATLPTRVLYLGQLFVHLRVHETWIRIPVHQGVDLELSFVENVRGWLLDIAVDDVANARIQAHLFMSYK